jgi:hypothetical protein
MLKQDGDRGPSAERREEILAAVALLQSRKDDHSVRRPDGTRESTIKSFVCCRCYKGLYEIMNAVDGDVCRKANRR